HAPGERAECLFVAAAGGINGGGVDQNGGHHLSRGTGAREPCTWWRWVLGIGYWGPGEGSRTRDRSALCMARHGYLFYNAEMRIRGELETAVLVGLAHLGDGTYGVPLRAEVEQRLQR